MCKKKLMIAIDHARRVVAFEAQALSLEDRIQFYRELADWGYACEQTTAFPHTTDKL